MSFYKYNNTLKNETSIATTKIMDTTLTAF